MNWYGQPFFLGTTITDAQTAAAADQYAADQALVLASRGIILAPSQGGSSILGIDGTYIPSVIPPAPTPANDRIGVGSQWLAQKFKQYASVSVVYSRGSDSVTLLATKGATQHNGFGPDGAIILYQQIEWNILATDLVLASAQAIPKIGDRIYDGSNTYEVTNAGGMEVCWTWCGGSMVNRKVFTKLVNT